MHVSSDGGAMGDHTYDTDATDEHCRCVDASKYQDEYVVQLSNTVTTMNAERREKNGSCISMNFMEKLLRIHSRVPTYSCMS